MAKQHSAGRSATAAYRNSTHKSANLPVRTIIPSQLPWQERNASPDGTMPIERFSASCKLWRYKSWLPQKFAFHNTLRGRTILHATSRVYWYFAKNWMRRSPRLNIDIADRHNQFVNRNASLKLRFTRIDFRLLNLSLFSFQTWTKFQ